ncbi:CfaE/CblD family pilus tip adhesin [Pantoea stewartii]|uniref:CfaE/CblD family pilus tip adhesin n=1 Tax=Pantoea stewartii TaxID=66269 RepID=UPI000A92C2BE|nr:CfaE/CblD family pilus tip adhesin [Pantoea stewartii]
MHKKNMKSNKVKLIFTLIFSFFLFISNECNADLNIQYQSKNIPRSQFRNNATLGTIYLTRQWVRASFEKAAFPTAPKNGTRILVFFTLPSSCPSVADGALMVSSYNYSTPRGCNQSVDNFIGSFYLDYEFSTDYEYSFSGIIPRLAIFDVIVLNSDKAMSVAGNHFTINSLPGLKIKYISKTDYSYTNQLSTPLQIPIPDDVPMVYFPQTNSSTTQVKLPVAPSSSGLAAGSVDFDLCVYDGAGLSKPVYQLTFIDSNSVDASSDFILRNGQSKIKYKASITSPAGVKTNLENNKPILWNDMVRGGAAGSRIINITPRGQQDTVPCFLATMSLKVKPVQYKSLKAGKYNGTINIAFSASTG